MRTLFLLRGAPASGKSTWIKENMLEPYTLCADEIRLLYQSPLTSIEGEKYISQNNDTEVWKLLMQLLEGRMKKGEFVVVDATHYKSALISRYKDLVTKYRYRVYVVNFAEVPEEECIRRNLNRTPYKKVPEEVIRKMYACLHDDTEVKKAYKLITPSEATNMLREGVQPVKCEAEKVVIFGDIHGCYAPLKEYFDKYPFSKDNCYIFCGDYLDRGIQNKEVLEFLLSIYKEPNVFLIEGNHECVHKETEVLTDNGWVNIIKLTEEGSDKRYKPLTYNVQKNCIEVDEIKARHKKFQEKMIKIETNNTKQIVSFNHEVLLGNKKVLAKDLLSFTRDQIEEIQHSIRPTSSMNLGDYDVPDNMLRLITWIVCDGCLVNSNKNKPNLAPKLRVQFKLSKENKITLIENLLKETGIEYTKKKATKSEENKLQPYLIRFYGSAAKKIFNYFPNGKEFPEFFRQISKRQLEIVLKTISSTDGALVNKRVLWYTKSAKNIDIIQEACVKNGYSLRVDRKNESGFKKGSSSFVCTITEHWDWVKLNNSIEVVDYNDYSYCISTNNGTLITRIDGKCAITGNCWLREYSSKDYEEVKDKEKAGYYDFYLSRISEQLDYKRACLQKAVRRNTNTMEELSKLLREAREKDPEATEVWYEFEKVNVPKKQQELSELNKEYQKEIDHLGFFVLNLRYEKENSARALERAVTYYNEEFGEGLSFSVDGIIRKKLGLERPRFENPIRSAEFLKNTVPQIKDIDKSQIRQLCQKFIQMSYFEYGDKTFFVSHGGLPSPPTITTPTEEMIKGVGKYEEHVEVDNNFEKNTLSFHAQIHGHRNVMREPVIRGKRTFNLEGQVEFGGHLRVLELIKDNLNRVYFYPIEIKNDIYKEEEVETTQEKTDVEVLKEMLHSKLIDVKELNDNVISLNFSRDAFYSSSWNSLTCTARGLFVDKSTGDIVARSFSKFFNHNEVDETTTPGLKQTFKFPVVGYKKENGFLGIVTKYKGDIKFFTKSSDKGDYVNWFIGVLCDHYGIKWVGDTRYSDIYNESENAPLPHNVLAKENLKEMVIALKSKLNPYLTEGYSYVFECVDKDNDPHIIKYERNNVYLLEVFKNQLKEEHIPYDDLIGVASALGVPLKQSELYFTKWEEFEDWKEAFTKGLSQWDCRHEGYVFEDANGFRVKFKSAFYKFWKQMRGVKDGIQSGRGNKKIYKTKEEIQVVKIMEAIPKDTLKSLSIIDIEDKFYETYWG